MSRLTVALAQIDSTVGDLDGNAEKIRAGIDRARTEGAQLVVFPELALTGYPPEDLLIKTHFLRRTADRLQELAGAAGGGVAAVGAPPAGAGGSRGGRGRACRVPAAAGRRLQRMRRARRRPGASRVPQDLSAQLRRLRRPALLPTELGARADRGRRDPGGPDDLRGHLAARAARHQRGAGRGAGERQPLRVAAPRGPGTPP